MKKIFLGLALVLILNTQESIVNGHQLSQEHEYIDFTQEVYAIDTRRTTQQGTEQNTCEFIASVSVQVLSEMVQLEGFLTRNDFLKIFEEKYNNAIDYGYLLKPASCDTRIVFKINNGRSITDTFRMYERDTRYSKYTQIVNMFIATQRLDLLNEIIIKKQIIDMFERNAPSQEIEKFIDSTM